MACMVPIKARPIVNWVGNDGPSPELLGWVQEYNDELLKTLGSQRVEREVGLQQWAKQNKIWYRFYSYKVYGLKIVVKGFILSGQRGFSLSNFEAENLKKITPFSLVATE